MFPFVYGFHWSAGYLIFLGIFYAVLAVIGLTAGARAAARVAAARGAPDRGHPLARRFRGPGPTGPRCRHEIAGHVPHRICTRRLRLPRRAPITRRLSSRRGATAEPRRRSACPCRSTACTTAAIPGSGRNPTAPDRGSGRTWPKRLTGKPDELELPPVGSRVEVNGTGWKMRRFGAEVRVLSPLEGEVVAVGGPECEWFLKVKPSSFDLTHLLMGPEVKRWFVREMERLHVLLGAGELGPTLADGGAMLDDLPAANPRANWDAIWGGMFLEPYALPPRAPPPLPALPLTAGFRSA